MPAYMIITARLHDREAFGARYAKAAAELVARHGGEYVFRGKGAGIILEGEGHEGAVTLVSRWPDMAALQAFWNSPEYAALKQARQGLADVRVTAVEGDWVG